MNKPILSAAIVAVLTASAPFSGEAGATKLICAESITGNIRVAKKCPRDYVPVSADNFMDIFGAPKGFIATCHTVTSTEQTTTGTSVVDIRCGSKEFLLNYGEYPTPISLDLIRWSEIKYDGNVPIGVSVVAQSEIGTPAVFEIWSFTVTGTCCPRGS